jgi:hypothetical protein
MSESENSIMETSSLVTEWKFGFKREINSFFMLMLWLAGL